MSRHTHTAKNAANAKVEGYDWDELIHSLDADGTAVLPQLLDRDQCAQFAAGYPRDDLYRSRIVMARHGFGRGEYKYFSYPLPQVLQDLREALYAKLVPIANRWNRQMGIDVRYPTVHADFIRRCHRAGQKRPTPLILQYVEDDYNCLHQDLYGEHVFPLQVTVLLSKPGTDFEGGEFVVNGRRRSRETSRRSRPRAGRRRDPGRQPAPLCQPSRHREDGHASRRQSRTTWSSSHRRDYLPRRSLIGGRLPIPSRSPALTGGSESIESAATSYQLRRRSQCRRVSMNLRPQETEREHRLRSLLSDLRKATNVFLDLDRLLTGLARMRTSSAADLEGAVGSLRAR